MNTLWPNLEPSPSLFLSAFAHFKCQNNPISCWRKTVLQARGLGPGEKYMNRPGPIFQYATMEFGERRFSQTKPCSPEESKWALKKLKMNWGRKHPHLSPPFSFSQPPFLSREERESLSLFLTSLSFLSSFSLSFPSSFPWSLSSSSPLFLSFTLSLSL